MGASKEDKAYFEKRASDSLEGIWSKLREISKEQEKWLAFKCPNCQHHVLGCVDSGGYWNAPPPEFRIRCLTCGKLFKRGYEEQYTEV